MTHSPGGVAVVTGAARGIGRAIASRLGEDGYRLLLIDALPQVHETAEKLVNARARVGDVRDPGLVQRAMADAEALGSLEVVVTCAGTCSRAGFADMTLEEWNRDLDTNLTGVFLAAQAGVFPHMRRRGYGRIINVASVSGKVGGIGPVHEDGAGGRSGAAYAASKAGVINLTRWIAREVGRWGITCNAVAPGPIASEMTDGHSYAFDEAPIARFGDPEEVAAGVAYLAAPERGFTTGTCLHVDGGMVRA